MIERRVAMDVSDLPTEAFDARDLMWWGTLGFVVIEGFTLVLCAVAHVYLTENFPSWPPYGTRLPSLGAPTGQVIVMLGSLFVVRRLNRAAHARELATVRTLLTIATGISVVMVALRAWELTRSLNVRWDANAYGSAQWLVVGTHGTLLAIQLIEVAGMAAIFWLGPVEKKHFSDAADVAGYWMFIVLSWLPLFLLSFVVPRIG
jgi:cytochrome c oxidase subunit III